MTNTYQAYGKRDKEESITYIDGPFFADEKLGGRKEQTKRIYEIRYMMYGKEE